MSLRIFSLSSLVALCACGADPPPHEPPREKIACALDLKLESVPVCTLERNGALLIVHRPDGGFRRFELSEGVLRPADGAEYFSVTPSADGGFAIRNAEDIYYIPLAPPGQSDVPHP